MLVAARQREHVAPSTLRSEWEALKRDAAEMDGYMREWRRIWQGRSPLVLRPGSTAEVSRILAIASETRTIIVPEVARTTPEQLRARLQSQGLAPGGDADTVHALVGDDTRAQMRVLAKVMAAN